MRRKAIIVILGLAFFIGVLGFLGYRIIDKQNQNEKIKLSKEYLPTFEFYDLDSTIYSTSLKDKSLPIVIIHFNTECDHCQSEALLIHQNFKAFTSAQLVMVAPNNPKDILAFIATYGISKHKEIIVLWDKDKRFVSLFGPSQFPSVYIYSKEHRLLKEYHGEVKIEAITKYIN